jgi:hypothetical protein
VDRRRGRESGAEALLSREELADLGEGRDDATGRVGELCSFLPPLEE